MTEMTDKDHDASDGLDRRRMLKGIGAAGLAGGALTGTASASANTLTIQGDGDGVNEYRVTVSGEITETGGVPGGSEDRVLDDGKTAEGKANGADKDTFEFTGEIESFEWVNGGGKVFVNGERVTFEKLTNRVVIEAGDERVSYRFRVSGRVEKGPEAGTLGVDTIDGNEVRGEVGGSIEGQPDHVDEYWYSGAIAFDEADGPMTVTLEIDSD